MKIFDFTSLLDLLMNDTDAVKTLLKDYKTQTEEHLHTLKEHIRRLADGEDAALREAVKKDAHLIKGSSLNITAEALGSTMLEMEKGAKDKTKEELLQLSEKAAEDFKNLCSEIAAVLPPAG